MRPEYFILDGHEAVPVDVLTWGLWFETHREERIVKQDIDEGSGWKVSTVFLGLDHQWRDGGPPHLFETMVFAPERRPVPAGLKDVADLMRRYSTWDEAESGHAAVVATMRAAFAKHKGGRDGRP
jgi:hypothetical protein